MAPPFEQNYYEAIAQVLPVLLLVIAVETRLFTKDVQRGPLDFAALTLMGFIAAGELGALRALADGSDSVFIEVVTVGAVACGLIYAPIYFAFRVGTKQPLEFFLAMLLGLAIGMGSILVLWPSAPKHEHSSEVTPGRASLR